MKICFSFLLIFYISICSLSAQSKAIDSLNQILKTTKVDSIWFESLYKKARIEFDSSLKMEAKADAYLLLQRADKVGDNEYIAKAHFVLFNFYKDNNQFDSASYSAMASFKYASITKDNNLISNALCNQARISFILQEYEQTVEFAEKALAIFTSTGVGYELRIYDLLTTAYSFLNKDKNTILHFSNLLLKSIESTPNLDFKTLSILYSDCGVAAFFIGDYTNAIKYYKKAYNYSLQSNDKANLPIDLINIGEAYGYLGDYKSALHYLNKGYKQAQIQKDAYVTSSALSMLSDIYEKKGDKENALKFFKKYVVVKDSIFSLEKAKQIEKMKTLYETEKKQKDILELQHEKQITNIELEKSKNRNLVFGASAMLLLLFSIGVFWGYLQVNKSKKEVEKRNKIISEINEELKASEEALIISNRTKDKFFALIAHDLRGPITSLSGIGKLLHFNIKKDNIEKISAIISQLDQSTVAVHHLLDNLLKWALSQSGALHFNPVAVNIEMLLKDIFAIFEEAAKAKSIHFSIEVSPNATVMADYNMLSTIIRNLIANAIKFTPIAGKVDVKAITIKEKLEITIHDSGVGMTKEAIDKIMQNENLASLPGTIGEKGTGLGLSLSKEFVLLHGSELSIESYLNEGTKISFSLNYI